MTKYLANRSLQLIPTVFLVTVAIFFLLRLIPGDPALVMLGPNATPDRVAQVHRSLGLDKPLWQQYGIFVLNLLRGGMGTSIFYRRAVSEVIADRLVVTLSLVLYGNVLMLVFAIPLAIVAALYRDRLVDHLIRIVMIVPLVMPSFWSGLLLMMLFGVRLRVLPVSGYGDRFWGHLYHLFLPALTIALRSSSLLVRNLRSSLLEVIQADYVRTARSKGLSEHLIFGRHVLRNALISTTSLVGVMLGYAIGGTVIIESVFNIPGIGSLMVSSIGTRDYPVVQAVTVVFALFVIVVNLLTDLTYSVLDPRVRYQ
jgi:peptide/nickel transport system permease protein